MAGSQIQANEHGTSFFLCRCHDKHSPSVDSHKIKCTHTHTAKGTGCDSWCHAHSSCHSIAAPIWGLCSSNIFATISFRLLGKFTFSYAAIFNKKLFDFISFRLNCRSIPVPLSIPISISISFLFTCHLFRR